MKRVILKAPSGMTLSKLTEVQQAAICHVFGQFVAPMPGTVESGGVMLIDATTSDDFNPTHIAGLGLPFTVMGGWQWSGFGALVELQAIDADFIDFLPGSLLHEPHRWAGWPEAF